MADLVTTVAAAELAARAAAATAASIQQEAMDLPTLAAAVVRLELWLQMEAQAVVA